MLAQENCCVLKENWRVSTQNIKVHLFKLILCRPLNSKWETLCRHKKSLEIVVWTQLCFDWFKLFSVHEDFCVSIQSCLVQACVKSSFLVEEVTF